MKKLKVKAVLLVVMQANLFYYSLCVGCGVRISAAVREK